MSPIPILVYITVRSPDGRTRLFPINLEQWVRLQHSDQSCGVSVNDPPHPPFMGQVVDAAFVLRRIGQPVAIA